MEIQKSPWFKHRDFESLYFNTRRFKNLHVLKHGGFVEQNCSYFPISLFQYTEIQKLPCFIQADFFSKSKELSEIATDEENILGCESGD